MADPIRQLAARVEGHYQILSAGLTAVRREMAEGFAETHETFASVQNDVQSVRNDVQSVQKDLQSVQNDLQSMQTGMQSMQAGMQSMQAGMQSMQGSIARLARQQDDRAVRVDALLADALQSLRDFGAALKDAFEVLAMQYDVFQAGLAEIDAMKERLKAVEQDVGSLKRKEGGDAA